MKILFVVMTLLMLSPAAKAQAELPPLPEMRFAEIQGKQTVAEYQIAYVGFAPLNLDVFITKNQFEKVTPGWIPTHAAVSNTSDLLPEPIVKLLDQKYPGSPRGTVPRWKLADVAPDTMEWWKSIQSNAAHPAVAQGDFDNNGLTDYVVLIWYGETFYSNGKPPTPNACLVAFLGQTSGYKLLELNGGGMNWPEFVDRASSGYRFLTVAPKGTRRFDWDTGKPLIYEHDTLEAWVNQVGGSAYRNMANESYLISSPIRRSPLTQR